MKQRFLERSVWGDDFDVLVNTRYVEIQPHGQEPLPKIPVEFFEQIASTYGDVKMLARPFEGEGGAMGLVSRIVQGPYTHLWRLMAIERIEDTNAFLARVESRKTGKAFTIACEIDIREAEESVSAENNNATPR